MKGVFFQTLTIHLQIPLNNILEVILPLILVKKISVFRIRRYVKIGSKLFLACAFVFYFFSSQSILRSTFENTKTNVKASTDLQISSIDQQHYSQVMEDRVDEKNDHNEEGEIYNRVILGRAFSQIPYRVFSFSPLLIGSKYGIYDINCCWKHDLTT